MTRGEHHRSGRRTPTVPHNLGADAPNSPFLLFLGGIYGAGKTTFCRELSEAIGATHVTASALIRHEALPGDTTGKAVADIDGNQRLLLDGLRAVTTMHTRVLLDGHFCVLDALQRVAVVPAKVFAAMKPTALLCLEVDPEEALQRLAKRGDGVYAARLLESLAAAEATHASALSELLGIPLVVVEQNVPAAGVAARLRNDRLVPED
jgi:adenylate kinase